MLILERPKKSIIFGRLSFVDMSLNPEAKMKWNTSNYIQLVRNYCARFGLATGPFGGWGQNIKKTDPLSSCAGRARSVPEPEYNTIRCVFWC